MVDYFTRCNNWIGHHMFLLVGSAMVVGFTMPLTKLPFVSTLIIALFAYITFVSALGTSYKDFFQVLTKPSHILLMVVLIHGVMPLVAWVVGHLFYPHDHLMRIGFLISAFIPIGVTSIIWTSLAGGNVSLALASVTVDTLLGTLLIPFYFTLIASQVVQINFIELLVGLMFMVIIPSLLGMAVNDVTRGKLAKYTRSVGGFTSKIALFFVVYISASTVANTISWDASTIKMLGVILLLTTCGYMLGCMGSLLVRDRRRETVTTIIYNVAMRNTCFGSALAVAYFPPAVAVPVTLAMLFQQPMASLVLSLLNYYYSKRKNGDIKTNKKITTGNL